MYELSVFVVFLFVLCWGELESFWSEDDYIYIYVVGFFVFCILVIYYLLLELE
jgi:hypothetical protein